LKNIRGLQKDGGIFLHLQDPNGDYLADPELKERALASYSGLSESVARFHPRRVLGRLFRELAGKQGDDYISKTNRTLIEQGVITSKLSVAELFSITDIHVHDGRGISMKELRGLLPYYELLSQRSYAFFGALESALPDHLREAEDELIATRALNGHHVAAAWMLKH
jgi:hypothetical protein